ncbi:Ada metal-binding domain-containing protein [Pseudochryseolinea flava]|uniref:Metal-binding protein n=1 Tax=Pseudochryseolinea flava TaxID=2059302 RepID=A0A364Y8T1_9BACT|nr:Ada metal-binding domain-containing protein [Pseudochryseolinea flava]RAW02642.1 metal-binding protein [Pseudochryseolinea flava]
MFLNHTISKRDILRAIRRGDIVFAGHAKLKIFGRLNCRSGKRMNKVHRVFFRSEGEAIAADFRPCGHCMRQQYLHWKNASSGLKIG